MIDQSIRDREQGLYDVVLQEVATAGGPTERCQAIFQQGFTANHGMRKRKYWEAVRHGEARFQNNKRR